LPLLLILEQEVMSSETPRKKDRLTSKRVKRRVARGNPAYLATGEEVVCMDLVVSWDLHEWAPTALVNSEVGEGLRLFSKPKFGSRGGRNGKPPADPEKTKRRI